jgi:hypothetical protein
MDGANRRYLHVPDMERQGFAEFHRSFLQVREYPAVPCSTAELSTCACCKALGGINRPKLPLGCGSKARRRALRFAAERAMGTTATHSLRASRVWFPAACESIPCRTGYHVAQHGVEYCATVAVAG